ncbi:hypothetical protein PHPALM_28700 [Phytophthora palmivora]|uniref:HAT C-terminal dimerisation domain-containing protein n=1 Tax=Phytophthora palmivora TaxID=4796 RepID=A0A2P4X9D9_9STRA|nr:hypothetical protein PHPALM_28700 [Phytophthora palmivora]
MRNVDIHDITVDALPADRGQNAVCVMKYLLRRFSPLRAIVLALQWRGNNRVIRSKDAGKFLLLIRRLGRRRAWEIALSLGYFLHRDLPVLPMIAFDLNEMSDTDWRKRFRFDHDGIKRLVILLQIPAVLITPYHGHRFSAVEGLCLLLERLSYPRSYAEVSQPVELTDSVCHDHRRSHALKFQILVTPDDLISHLFDPFPGRSHDVKMFRDSQIATLIRSDPRQKLPLSAPVARKYLGVVATSVSSERCFSSTGNVVTAHRTRLSSGNVRDVVLFTHVRHCRRN